MSSILRQFLSKSVQNFARNRVLIVPQVVSGRRCLPSWGPPPKQIDRKDIEFRVLQTLGKHDKIDLNSLKLDSNLIQDLGLDSLDVVECVVELEDEFAIEVNDKDVDRLTTVASVVEYVCDRLSSVVDQFKRPDIEFKEHMVKKRPVD